MKVVDLLMDLLCSGIWAAMGVGMAAVLWLGSVALVRAYGIEAAVLPLVFLFLWWLVFNSLPGRGIKIGRRR